MPKLPAPADVQSSTVPTGTYKVQILGFEHTNAKSGTPQMKWKAKIVEPEEFSGQTLVEWCAMTDAAIWKTSNLLGGCGLVFTQGIDTTSSYFDGLCQATQGRTSYWRNELGQDNKGNERNNIRAFEVDPDQEQLEYVEEDDATPSVVFED